MFWINGQLAESVSTSDRSFQYGDGCFSTILTRNGYPQLWDYHLKRLQSSLTRLAITPPDWKQVLTWISDIALPDDKAGVKLHISRGKGGRGYSPKGISQPSVTLSRFLYPEHYGDWQQNGIDLIVCDTRLGINPLLAGMKHNNRLEQVLIKNELEQKQATDGVVLDISGHVIEASMANIFWVSDDTLYTPQLHQSGVAGVMRHKILELSSQHSLRVVESSYVLDDLFAAKEVFICNALLGIAPVKAIENQKFTIGKTTKYLQKRVLT
ncbi:aminodeoxychorismate lyase [Vibrio viridaestus]|uniref:Aminodeoxychorismate lyase n=1 Tax=Vibrio viridaestus TaxID=2487322 RepID=A0A3N9U7Q7_9VIBR|nr:aminodeoxychorismate lyase [Vibrio viridaestus]RQW64216.1 aminodeoxychorismate lyase [Vibrio viridaestus]